MASKPLTNACSLPAAFTIGNMKRHAIWKTLLGLFVCYVIGTQLARILVKVFAVENTSSKVILILACQIITAALVLFVVKKIEGRDLTSIAMGPFVGARDIKWGLMGFGIGGMSFALTGPLVEYYNLGSTIEGITFMGELPVWQRIFIAFTAGTCEEIYLRAYPIERLSEYCSPYLAALITIVIFMALHIPFWSLGGALQIGVATVVWTAIYLKTRSVWAVMIMHVCNDLFAFVFLPYVFAN